MTRRLDLRHRPPRPDKIESPVGTRCGVDGCPSPPSTRGWCRLHYQRWRKYDDPGRARPTVADRLAAHSEDAADCRIWTAAKDPDGYGLLRVDGTLRRVTRIVWELAYGLIPDGLSVLHACDTPSCVQLDHLMLGTQIANVRDALNKRRRPQNQPRRMEVA